MTIEYNKIRDTLSKEPPSIDWNVMSDLGLITRINHEILHPLGLSMSRNIHYGDSDKIYIADDLVWKYSKTVDLKTKTSEEIKTFLKDYLEKLKL